MVKVIRVDADGNEVAAVELDDFTIEIVYAGIATLLAEAASRPADQPARPALSRLAQERQARILNRILA